MPRPSHEPRPARSDGAHLAARPFSRHLFDHTRAQAAFDRQHDVDELGTRVQLALAMLWCFFVSAPIAYVEFGGIPLLAFFLWRLPKSWRTLPSLLVQPHAIFLILWMAWLWASLLWTSTPPLAIEEAGAIRFAWVILAMWPVMDRRPWIIAAYALGLALAQSSQLAQAIGESLGRHPWHRAPDRLSGWSHPVVLGSILTGAVGLHLAGLTSTFSTYIQPKARRATFRALAALGLLTSALGVIATGTRGAWIASMLLACIFLLNLARRAPRAARPRIILATAIAAAILAALALTIARGPIERRFGRATHEISAALREKQFTSDTGARLLMNWWAIEAWTEHPAIGVGAGSYPDWVRTHLEDIGIDPSARSIHDHAHSAPLHTLATLGAIGALLCATAWILTIAGGMTPSSRRRASDANSDAPTPSAPSLSVDRTRAPYDTAPGWALLGIALAGLFDVVQINVQTSAHLFTLAALCAPWRPLMKGKSRP
ncbi:MAG: O-antigen ligase family protein [Phycisphaerales bacterium]|nr:O-antigen ligase family protein [Phycisphaerales bacterium]